MGRLVSVIESGLRPRADVSLRVIDGGAPTAQPLHDIDRESHCRMIRHFRRAMGYAGQMLIDQAAFGYASMEQLPDDELIRLHQDMERAMECIRDGVSFEDAGLIRYRYG